MWSRMTPAAPSTYSAEYTGSDRATHSPHPSVSGPMTRTSRTSRSVSVPKEVWKGATNSSRIRRSSTFSIFILNVPWLWALEWVGSERTNHPRVIDSATNPASMAAPRASRRASRQSRACSGFVPRIATMSAGI